MVCWQQFLLRPCTTHPLFSEPLPFGRVLLQVFEAVRLQSGRHVVFVLSVHGAADLGTMLRFPLGEVSVGLVVVGHLVVHGLPLRVEIFQQVFLSFLVLLLLVR